MKWAYFWIIHLTKNKLWGIRNGVKIETESLSNYEQIVLSMHSFIPCFIVMESIKQMKMCTERGLFNWKKIEKSSPLFHYHSYRDAWDVTTHDFTWTISLFLSRARASKLINAFIASNHFWILLNAIKARDLSFKNKTKIIYWTTDYVYVDFPFLCFSILLLFYLNWNERTDIKWLINGSFG